MFDSSGNYSFIGVPLTGEYVISVSAPQFKPVEQKDLLLRAGGTAVLDFTLTVSGTNTQVNVYGTTDTVQVSRTRTNRAKPLLAPLSSCAIRRLTSIARCRPTDFRSGSANS